MGCGALKQGQFMPGRATAHRKGGGGCLPRSDSYEILSLENPLNAM